MRPWVRRRRRAALIAGAAINGPGGHDAGLGRLDLSALNTLSAADGSSDSSGSQAAGTPSPSQVPPNRSRTDCPICDTLGISCTIQLPLSARLCNSMSDYERLADAL
jgi:hypothetical protein